MITKHNAPALTVLLRQRVIIAERLVFDAEREVTLPIQPFIGLHLYNTTWVLPGSDESEEQIEDMAEI